MTATLWLRACVVAITATWLAGCATTAAVAPADLVVTNARIATLDASGSTAGEMAVRGDRIVAIGGAGAARGLVGPGTRTVDAGGRTVIPGLIDSHMHAIRAALSYSTEVNWIGADSIGEAMARVRHAAEHAAPGGWLIVAGGWTEAQFAEKRRPTLAELAAAAPDHPVYIQLFYSAIAVTPRGLQALGLAADAPPQRLAVERDAAGQPTGWWSGDIIGISTVFDRLPKPDYRDNLEGTRRFFTELNRLGVTGVLDPGGFNIAAPQYAALFQLWRERALTLRVRYSLFAQRGGAELDEFKNLTQLLPMGFGDGMLRFNGIGERLTFGLYNNDKPTDAQKAQFLEATRWAARQGLTLTIHWQNNASVGQLLDLFEQVDRETPLAPLRWSIAHLNDGTPETFARMRRLGLGWTLQDAMYFEGDSALATRGAAAAADMPPIMTALRAGVPVGAGTDAHRVASYNPFVALQWMLDGKTVGGRPMRGPAQTPSREQALRLYTQGSAWFSFDEGERGSLEVGKLADFALLDRDFFSVPVEQIGRTEALLTVVGGKPVYGAGPFRTLAPGAGAAAR